MGRGRPGGASPAFGRVVGPVAHVGEGRGGRVGAILVLGVAGAAATPDDTETSTDATVETTTTSERTTTTVRRTTTTTAPTPTTVAPTTAPGASPFASDVDCQGGRGNGPAYTGRVNVLGPDVYGLDNDGDEAMTRAHQVSRQPLAAPAHRRLESPHRTSLPRPTHRARC